MTKTNSMYRVLTAAALYLASGCSSSEPAAPGEAMPQLDAGPDSSEQGDSSGQDAAQEDGSRDGALSEGGEEADSETCSPVAASPVTGPSGCPLDGWSWQRHGVVLEDPSAGAQGGYIAPAATVVDNTLHLWVTHKQGTTHRIMHCTSSDGQTFSAPRETTGLEGQDIIAYPTVLHRGSEFWMWYGSGSIDHARSSDGDSWTMIATGVLRPGDVGAFDSLSLLYPNVVATDAGYAMYYTGFDGQSFGIGRAESADGLAWSRSPSAVVIAHGAPADFDNHAAAQPCAVAGASGVLLWYGGYDTSIANPGPYRIGLAQAADGKAFVRRGVTLDLEASGQEAWSTRDPAVVRWNGRWWMAYSAMGDDGRYRIAVATSDTCMSD